MLVDIVRKPLFPTEDYEYMVYSCSQPSEGITVDHLETSDVVYNFATVLVEDESITCRLFTTEYLAGKSWETLPVSADVRVVEIR